MHVQLEHHQKIYFMRVVNRVFDYNFRYFCNYAGLLSSDDYHSSRSKRLIPTRGAVYTYDYLVCMCILNTIKTYFFFVFAAQILGAIDYGMGITK